jgi:hypothetical protein
MAIQHNTPLSLLLNFLKIFVPAFVKRLYRYLKLSKNSHKTTKEIFSEIKKKNLWGNTESVSGFGSVLAKTETLVIELSKLFKEKSIKTVLDIPCGDFNWMRKIDFSGMSYIGADIVDELIEENMEKYGTENINFSVKNIIDDVLPKSDIIFVRDCFVHLSYKNIFESINNIKKSGSRYLLTTTFTGINKNYDIITGDWRPLNLQIKPFMFPEPKYIIVEKENGQYKDKSIGLWEIDKL